MSVNSTTTMNMNSMTSMSSMDNMNCSCMSLMSMMNSMMTMMDSMKMMVPFWHVQLAADYLLIEPWFLNTAGCMPCCAVMRFVLLSVSNAPEYSYM